MATQSSDRSCRVYQVSLSTQDGSSSTSGVGRIAVKCCNVIKSCVVKSEELGGEASRYIQGVQTSHDAAAHEVSKVDTGMASRGIPPTATEGEDKSRAKPLAKALTDISNESTCVTDGETGSAAITEACDADGTGGRVIVGGVDEDNLATNADSKDKAKSVQRKNLFVDETVTSFFRRLSWSPDGAFLITPTAQYWDSATRKTQFCTYLFMRGQFVKWVGSMPVRLAALSVYCFSVGCFDLINMCFYRVPQQASCMPSWLKQAIHRCQMQSKIVCSQGAWKQRGKPSRGGTYVWSSLPQCVRCHIVRCCGGLRHGALTSSDSCYWVALFGTYGCLLVRKYPIKVYQ